MVIRIFAVPLVRLTSQWRPLLSGQTTDWTDLCPFAVYIGSFLTDDGVNMDRIPGTLIPPTRDEFKARSFRIKATYAYEILHD